MPTKTKPKAKLPESLQSLVSKKASRKKVRRRISEEAWMHLRGHSHYGWPADHGLETTWEYSGGTPGNPNFFVCGQPEHVQKVVDAAAVIDEHHKAKVDAHAKRKTRTEQEDKRTRAALAQALHKVAASVLPGVEPWPSKLDYTMDHVTALSVVRLAAIFGRQSRLSADKNGEDAVRVVKLGAAARRALKKKHPTDKYVQLANVVAKRYGAEALLPGDLDAWVMTLKFPKGTTGAHDDEVFVA